MSTQNSRRTWLRWFGLLISAAAIAYLLRIVIRGDILSELKNISIDLGSVIVVFLLYLLALILQYLIWIRLASLYRKIDWHDVDIFSRTIFMRRLPGGFWHWLGRTALYGYDEKLPEKQVARGNLIEWSYQLLTGLIILLGVAIDLSILIPAALVCILISIAYRLMKAWYPVGTPKTQITTNMIGILGLYTLTWLISVWIFGIVIHMTPVIEITSIEILRIWLITGLVGVLTIPLPVTFGIQAAVLIIQLQNLMPIETALIIAVQVRIIYILADFFWGFLGWTSSRLAIRRRGY